MPMIRWELPALGCFALIAGSAFLFTSIAKASFPPLTLVALRLLLGCIGLLGANAVHNGLKALGQMSVGEVASLVRVGLLNTTAPYTLYAVAMTQGVGTGFAAVLAGSSPLMAAVCTAVLNVPPGAARALLNSRRLAGLLLGFTGVLLIALYKHMLSSQKHHAGTAPGTLLFVSGCSCKAAAAVFAQYHNEKFVSGSPALAQAFVQATAGLAVALLLALALDCTQQTPRFLDPRGLSRDSGADCIARLSHVSAAGWMSLAYLGVFSSCIVYVLQFFLVARVGAVRQCLVDYIIPVVGVLEGIFFGEDLERGSVEGIALGAAGVLLATGSLLLNWPDGRPPVDSCSDCSEALVGPAAPIATTS